MEKHLLEFNEAKKNTIVDIKISMEGLNSNYTKLNRKLVLGGNFVENFPEYHRERFF